VASEFDEHGHDPALTPEDTLVINARGKAREVSARSGVPPGGAVLGADTGVVVDGGLLGKPGNAAEAGRMLDALAGREHHVQTAICLMTERVELSECDTTTVRVRRLPRAARDWYVELGEWRDRAGGYAIQGSGSALVEGIEGDYTTVVGLPVGRLVGLLAVTGLAPWGGPVPLPGP
jgi:septum formation protein